MQKKANPTTEDVEKQIAYIPGAEPSARIDAWWGLVLGVVGLVAILCILWPDPYLRMVVFMLDGILVTILVTISSFILILIAGLFGALARLSSVRFFRGFSTIYVEIMRGIPLMVQLLWWYFAFPAIIRGLGDSLGISALSNYSANAIVMGIMGLTICYGAYMTEIYRAGIQSIPRGQMEAARSLGMNYIQAMRHVVLPQALRVILPPVGNEFTALLKDSSLVSVVVVADMTRRAREFISTNFNPISGWTMLALLYLILTLFSARVASYIEKKYSTVQR
jgi:polar amino acid transport system permease protein